MSPEIRIDGHLIADTPDETGWHKAINGGDIYIDVDGIGADNLLQNLTVISPLIAGRPGSSTERGERIVQLSPSGRGSQELPRGRMLKVVLKERPIRESTQHVSGIRKGRTNIVWRNPHWTRPNARR